MKVALFSDLHLDIKNAQEKWLSTAYEFIDHLTDICHKKNIKNIFFLGDWYNNRASVSGLASNATNIILEKLKDFTLYVFPGNHDLFYCDKPEISSISIFKGYPNIKFYDKLSIIELDNKKITLAPWGTNPLDNKEDSDYLFGHLEINTFNMNSSSDKVCEDGLTLSDLLKKYKNIFSGHFHKAQKRVYSVGMVQYIGNPFQLNFGESKDNKGFVILDLDTGDYEFCINNISPKFIILELSKLIKLSYKEIEDICKNNYVKLIIDKNITIEDSNELSKLISLCSPNEFIIDWDNVNTLVTNKEKVNFKSIDFISTLEEYVDMLDVADSKEIKTYLNNVYNLIER